DCALRLSSVTLSGEKMSELELMKFYKFNSVDLAANRLLRLSEKQEKEITNSDKKAFRSWFGYIVVLILIGAVFSSLLFQASPSPRLLPEKVIGLGIIWSIVGVLVAGIVYFMWRSRKVDYSVFSAEGSVHFELTQREQLQEHANGDKYYKTEKELDFYVGETVFKDVDPKIKKILKEGDVCKLYYLKNADGRILSAEKVK
ncbi:MAG TPA: hypothetical protein PKX08_20040, partial [Cyclobacteriaceae bacterium]|nr:hypothetical protein [Cyclobacteriaceae bacterium]